MSRRWLLALVFVAGLAAAAGLGWYGWRRYTAPVPPEIARDQLDPDLLESIETARKKIQRDPYSASHWGDLGRLLRAALLLPEATACFAQAERLDPKNPRWPYLQGESLAKSDAKAALPHLERAAQLSVNGDTVAPHLRLAEALLALGRAEEAESHLRRALQIEPDNPSVHYNLGLAALARGDLPAALEQLRKGEHSPFTQRRACIQLAAVYRRMGDLRQADQYSRKADELPNDANWIDPFLGEALDVGRAARFRQAEQMELRGDHRAAIELAQALIQEHPDYRSYILLAMNFGKLGQLADSEKALRAAIALEPDSFRAYKELSRLLCARGESLRATNPNRARADFEAGAEAARQALARRPNQATSHVTLGLCLRGLGKRKEALAAFRAAVDCGPDVAVAHLHLGEELADAGQIAEARTELERAAQLSPPDDDRARSALEKLKK